MSTKRASMNSTETAKDSKLRRRSPAAVQHEETANTTLSSCHTFHDPAEVARLRSQLLSWYDEGKRDLPWRTVALTEPDLNIRTYAVWVSEIMLQQTQVATVIDYYNRWMQRWPTVQSLAAATLEEVNQMWAGLGYYSRGRRLHEGAQKVVTELKGQIPRTVESLLKQLPGVGRYTAGAIGSIALGEVTGVVDGNVIRVLCRLRAIGADSTSPAVMEALWGLGNALVDPGRPGDFNQALMELGARVCTPKGAQCSRCPLRSHCRSYRKVHIRQEANCERLLGKLDKIPPTLPDIEDCTSPKSCALCPTEPWDDALGVQNFPRKPAKKAPRAERTLTCVVVGSGDGAEQQVLLTQRPEKGLLAGMWEFPSVLLEGDSSETKHKGALCAKVGRMLGVKLNRNLLHDVGEVVHVFSHIHQTYVVFAVSLKDCGADGLIQAENTQWISRSALHKAAVSTGVKKILKLYDSTASCEVETSGGKRKKNTKSAVSKKTPRGAVSDGRRQLSLGNFFRRVKEEP